jgi:ABC-type amino acid transport system permease subunit
VRVLRVYGGGVVRRLIGVYVEMIRNTPLLVQTVMR